MRRRQDLGSGSNSTVDSAVLDFGPFRVHPVQGLFEGDREIHVTRRSLTLLYRLARERGRILSKAELFEDVWSDRIVTDSALSSCIRELRKALGDSARNPRYIETLYGRGVRLRSVPSDAVVPSRDEIPKEGFDARPSYATAQPSIVILPFQPIDKSRTSAIVARGLVHDIITRLARSRALFVIARGTTFQLLTENQDVRTIGTQLGVRYAVQGAIRMTSSRLIVSVGLAETSTRQEIWSEQYSRKRDDFMRIQEEIVEQVVCCLESEVRRHETQKSLLMPSSDLDAWSAYHLGVHHMYKFTQPDCERAEAMFRRSIELEPGLPRPHAGLSFVHFSRTFLNLDKDRDGGMERAFDHAMESLSIDPMDPMGHWALSRALLLRGELESARRELETATDLNPSYAIAHYSLGWVGLELGENELCRERIAFARRLSPCDPLKFAMLGVYALNLAMMGDTVNAVPLAVESVEQPNAHHQALAFAAVTHALDGQSQKAGDYLARIRAIEPAYDIADFLAVYKFRRNEDIARIRGAFDRMRPHALGAVSRRSV